MDEATNSSRSLTLLSNLLLRADQLEGLEQIGEEVARYERDDLGQLWSLATAHHVIMRAFPKLKQLMTGNGNARVEWVDAAIKTEQKRIFEALSFLPSICQALGEAGEVIVIKSLDHWPDLGSDIDLYTTAKSEDVVDVMRDRFHARLAERSWGDRLAGKWNFIVPGLHELLEVHVGRLGQTGEQVAVTDSLVARASMAQFGSHYLRVPSSEDRIIISTLQRMYRHYYLRLCDIVDIARLVDSDAIDYVYLRSLARSCGLWEGVATYLVILAQYVGLHRGKDLELPPFIMQAAQFDVAKISLRRKFLRIPLFPQAARLYAKEWGRLFFNGELGNALRLSMLPGLAVAAAVSFRISGSDKGIW